MKYFVIYTVLRIGLFLATFAVLGSILVAIFDYSAALWIWTVVGAAVISSILSLKLLAGPREKFAQSVDARARRATAKLDEMRSREDVD